MGRKKVDITEEQSNEQLELVQKKNEVLDLEQFYANGTLNNLNELVEARKVDIISKIEKYAERMKGREPNPFLISNYFFKSINPMANVDLEYSAEKLAIVWDLYMELIEEVNFSIGEIQPTISHFCKFAGISTYKFKSYKDRGTLEMQVLANKISDATFDSNVLLAQKGKLSNRSTELRVKVENEVQEKPQVKVNVNVNEEVDLSQIASRINELSNFKNSQSNFEPIEVEVNE